MPIENIVRVIISSVFAIGFGFTGVYLTFQYLKARKVAKQTLDWPGTPGEVTTSWVKKGTTRNRNSYAIIKYTYMVMGKTYESDKLSVADSLGVRLTGPTSSAKRVTEQYPRGSKVTVYYDPQNPAHAVLERNLNSQNGQGLLVSTLLVDFVAIVAIILVLSNYL